MSKPANTKPSTQYLAKVRYSNTLPPPSCAAKLLDDEKMVREGEFDSLLPSYFQSNSFGNIVRLDDNMGMRMNLLDLPDQQTVYGLTAEGGLSLALHPQDQMLMTDPSKKIATKSENVGFLRRTQYISSDQSSVPQQPIGQVKMRKEEEINAKNIVKSVEGTFETISDLGQLKHPSRTKLKAKRVWNLLPDSSMFDTKFIDVKFLSSASIVKNALKDDIKSIQDPKLLTAILRQVELNANTKIVSLYTTKDSAAAEELHKVIQDTTGNAPINEQDVETGGKTYTFAKKRDYAGVVEPVEDQRHLAMTFSQDDNVAYYVPISGKIELKKTRVDPDLVPVLKKTAHGQIDLMVREPTYKELSARDQARAEFDPMEFSEE